jgi:Tol biopolymer transport system component/DNA-binding winged helix-turn-helix (wHTH) protein
MSKHDTTYLFGPFRLDPQDQMLLRDGEPVPLSPKGGQILRYLLQRPGELVSKDELLRELWQEQIVEEGALVQQVSHLRKALGDNPRSPSFILTIPGKGYLFNHPVTFEVPEISPMADGPREEPTPSLPAPGLSVEPLAVPSTENGTDWFRSYVSRRWLAGGLAVGGLLGTILLWIAFSSRQPPPSATEPVPTMLPLVTLPGVEGYPTFSPDGRWVAFTFKDDTTNHADLYIKEVRQGEVGQGETIRLTNDRRINSWPVWSPDGKRIAFLKASQIPTLPDSLAIITVPGGVEQEVAQIQEGHGLDWSPDGKLLVVSENRMPERICGLSLLTLVEEGGQIKARRVTRLTDVPRINGHHLPRFSPDGKFLVFVQSRSNVDEDLMLLDLATQQVHPLTNDRSEIPDLQWPRDSRNIFFLSIRTRSSELWMIDPQRGIPMRVKGTPSGFNQFSLSLANSLMVVTQSYDDTDISLYPLHGNLGEQKDRLSAKQCPINTSREEHTARFSPDGQSIVYVSNQTGFWELWLAKTDCTNIRQLTNLQSEILGSPRWSPDGSSIVFDHYQDGQPHIFTVETLTGLVKQQTSDNLRNITPSWSSDGRWIYYTSRRQGTLQCWKLPVGAGEARLINANDCFAPVESTDGRSLYFIRENALWSMELENGTEAPVGELREKLVARQWSLTPGALFYAPPKEGPKLILFRLDLQTRETKQVAAVGGPFFFNETVPRFDISADERQLVTYRVEYRMGDISLIENLRLK